MITAAMNPLLDISPYEKNVFVMMRYRETNQFEHIEEVIRKSLSEYSLHAHLAKDRVYTQLLWENIKIYLEGCHFGIAIFEEIDDRDFNPNISIELGYMLAQEKRCLLLKEQRMKTLPTDMCGHLYKNFDMFNIKSSISNQIEVWMHDLGISQQNIVLHNRIRMILTKSKFDIQKQILWCLYGNERGMTSEELRKACQHPMKLTGDGMTRKILYLYNDGIIVQDKNTRRYKMPKRVQSAFIQVRKELRKGKQA